MDDFDAVAMYEAMDAQRIERGLSWRQVADQMWEQSADLDPQRQGHPISPSTLTGIATRADTTCQHALFILRWLGRTPESFLMNAPADADGTRLPAAGRNERLRWNLAALYDALNTRRQEQGVTWVELTRQIRCSPNQLTGIRAAKYAIGMRLAMRIVQWLGRPAAAFIYPSRW
jgi:hypothetical protein